jgi:ribosomal protein L1
MGQKKIKVIGAEEDPVKRGKGKKKQEEKVEKKPKADKKAKEKAPEKKTAEKKEAKKTRPKKLRSKRYRKLRTYIDRQKFYPVKDAVKLLCKIANSKIDETVSLDLITRKAKLKAKVKLVQNKKEVEFKSEKKAPLLHAVIGKISLKEKKLEQNIEALIVAIGPKNIKKAVLSSTHSPGIKLEIEQPDRNKK